MAESLKDVIAKLKAQQNFQSSTPSQVPSQVPSNPQRQEIPRRSVGSGRFERQVEKPVQEEENLEDFDDEDDDELYEEESLPQKSENKSENTEKISEKSEINPEEIKKIQETISSLRDNGVFRLELLNNFQQINKNLTIITAILLELSGYGKEK